MKTFIKKLFILLIAIFTIGINSYADDMRLYKNSDAQKSGWTNKPCVVAEYSFENPYSITYIKVTTSHTATSADQYVEVQYKSPTQTTYKGVGTVNVTKHEADQTWTFNMPEEARNANAIRIYRTTSTSVNKQFIVRYFAVHFDGYTLTFDAQGGTASESTRIIEANKTYGTLPSCSKYGYDFDGWYTEASGGTKVNTTDVVLAHNYTLYAHWTAHTYELLAGYNGGTKGTDTCYHVAKTHKTPLTFDATHWHDLSWTVPTRPGYIFTGWYDYNGVQVYGSDGLSINGTYWNNKTYKYDGDLKVTAHWVPAEYIFDNATGDNNWNTIGNWKIGTEQATSLPTQVNNVQVIAEAHIYNSVEVANLAVNSNGKIVIKPTGGLSVYGSTVTLPNNTLTIEATITNTGFAKFKNGAPSSVISMQYASKGDLSTGANDDATWQYFGIPVNGVNFTPNNEIWMYKWSEPNDWEYLGQGTSVLLNAFQGYAITQYGTPTYTFTGDLITSNITLNLTNTPEGMNGDNLIANSYTAPIDVKCFTDDDFEGNVEKTFYIFNSGSWNQWNDNQESGQEYSGSTPGTYTAIPVLSASYLAEEQTTIPPMQGIYIKAYENDAKVTFNYAKHVWNGETNTNGLRSPKRIAFANDLTRRAKITISGKNSGTDYVYILERSDWSKQFDNGFDAHKELSDNAAINVYTNEVDGYMSVSATNQADSIIIGINTTNATEYTLTFSSVIGEDWKLVDLESGIEMPVENGQPYTFYANANTAYTNRFMVKKSDQDIATNLYTIYENYPEHIYSMDGQLITKTTIKNLPLGVYILINNGKATKFVKQ